MGYRFRVDPSLRVHVWATAASAVLSGPKTRTPAQAAMIADEMLIELRARECAGVFDSEREPEPERPVRTCICTEANCGCRP